MSNEKSSARSSAELLGLSIAVGLATIVAALAVPMWFTEQFLRLTESQEQVVSHYIIPTALVLGLLAAVVYYAWPHPKQTDT